MKTAGKRFFSLLLIAVLLLTVAPFAAFAAEHVCSAETTIEINGGYWECSCGKIYRTADCTGEALTPEAYLAALEAANAAAAAEQPAAEQPAAQQSAAEQPAAEQPTTVSAIEAVPGEDAAGFAGTKNTGLTFIIVDETGTPLASRTVLRSGEYLGNALAKGDFAAKHKLDPDTNFDNYRWPSPLVWTDAPDGTGNPYQPKGNLRDVQGATDKDGNPVGDGSISDTYYAVVYTKEIIVRVQVQWAEGNTTKTVDIVEPFSVNLASVKATEIVDYMADEGYTGMVRGFISAGTVTDKDSETYDVSGYSWNELWYGNGAVVNKTKFSKDVTIVAKLVKEKVTITFDPNGGKVNPTEKTIKTNTSTTLPVPTLEGYKFLGWFDNATDIKIKDGKAVSTSDDNKQYLNTTVFNTDKTLVAVWGEEVEVELYVYNSKKPGAEPTSIGTITGLLKDDTLTKADVARMLTNSTGMQGPFNNDGSGVDSWERFTQQGSAVLYLPKVAGGEKVAVYVPSGSINPSAPSSSTNVNGTTTNSSATYDPSNPKTGDAAALGLNVATIALTVSVLGLAGAYIFSRKRNFGL